MTEAVTKLASDEEGEDDEDDGTVKVGRKEEAVVYELDGRTGNEVMESEALYATRVVG